MYIFFKDMTRLFQTYQPPYYANTNALEDKLRLTKTLSTRNFS